MLRWQHDWGAKVEHWELVLAQGRPAPEPYLDRPEIWPLSEFYWHAFNDLASERQIGMGVGYIPWSKAKEYASHHGVDAGGAFDRFWAIVRAVDVESVKLSNAVKKDEDASGKDKSKAKPKSKPITPPKSKR